MKKVILITGGRRSNKIKPLLDDYDVYEVRNMGQFIKRCISTWSVDIIVSDTFGRYAVMALVSSWIYKAELSYRIRGDVIEEMRHNIGTSVISRVYWCIAFYVTLIAISQADKLICCSEYLAERMEEYVGEGAFCVVYTPLTFDTISTNRNRQLPNRKGNLDGPFRLITITNFDFEKKFVPTIGAIKYWLSKELVKKTRLSWYILGGGKKLDDARQVVNQKDIGERIKFRGHVDSVGKYLDRADVCVHFTKLDGFPNATLESMYYRLPVITNKESAGVREQVFHGVNGFVVDNACGFRSCLLRYYESGNLCRLHGNKGYKIVKKKWSVEKQRKRLTECFNRGSKNC